MEYFESLYLMYSIKLFLHNEYNENIIERNLVFQKWSSCFIFHIVQKRILYINFLQASHFPVTLLRSPCSLKAWQVPENHSVAPKIPIVPICTQQFCSVLLKKIRNYFALIAGKIEYILCSKVDIYLLENFISKASKKQTVLLYPCDTRHDLHNSSIEQSSKLFPHSSEAFSSALN